jgi:hypothetical protein
MRVATGGFVAALAFAATACGASDSNSKTAVSTADCADQVRLRGVVYTSYGFTTHGATRYAAADRADCQDTGTEPPWFGLP